MPRLLLGLLVTTAISVAGTAGFGAQEAPPPEQQSQGAAPDASAPAAGNAGGESGAESAPAGGAAAEGGGTTEGKSPKQVAETTPKGQLKSPYEDIEAVASEGKAVYAAAGCGGCHGGTGGGGMGPPLTNQIWIYGNDDDTLFRLIALGSQGLQAQGFTRKGSEAVVGPMPPQGEIVKSADDLWKIIAWIRSINPSAKPGATAGTESPQ